MTAVIDLGRALAMQSPMAVDRDTPTLSDYYTTMTESEIRKQVWLTQTDATYELVYQVKKTGIHTLTRAAHELDYSNREWQMIIRGTYHIVPACNEIRYS